MCLPPENALDMHTASETAVTQSTLVGRRSERRRERNRQTDRMTIELQRETERETDRRQTDRQTKRQREEGLPRSGTLHV